MGAGVPSPVHPKSQMQRRAAAKPRIEGTAASHRQRATPAISTLKPSHRGSSQNHSEKNTAPTASEAAAVSQRKPATGGAFGDSSLVIQLFLKLGSEGRSPPNLGILIQ